jgi:hypothetical protein
MYQIVQWTGAFTAWGVTWTEDFLLFLSEVLIYLDVVILRYRTNIYVHYNTLMRRGWCCLVKRAVFRLYLMYTAFYTQIQDSMWPLLSLYEQTAFSLGRVNKRSPYLAGQQHLWLFLQQSNNSLWKAGRYWRTRTLLSVTLCFFLGGGV